VHHGALLNQISQTQQKKQIYTRTQIRIFFGGEGIIF
jgi:hypothetical protein